MSSPVSVSGVSGPQHQVERKGTRSHLITWSCELKGLPEEGWHPGVQEAKAGILCGAEEAPTGCARGVEGRSHIVLIL